MTDRLPDGWRAVNLGDAATWYSGGTPRTSEGAYWGGDIPWITSGSLTTFRLRDSVRRLTSTGLANGSRLVPKGTTLFVVRGMSLKTEFRIGVADRPLAFGQDCKALVAKDGVDELFLAYAIRSRTRKILDLVDEAGHGTGRLNTDQLKNLSLGIPPVGEQRAIVDVLGALDDKIESNHRLAKMCRDLIRLELEVREGTTWCEAPVSRLARFVNGGAYTSGASGTGRMVIRIAELTKGAGGSTVYNDIDVPDDRMARPGDLLMAWSGSLGIHIWLGEEAVINQHIFKVVPDGVPAWLVFDRLERVMPEFRQIAADKATTMGHIKRHHLDDALVRVPVGQDLEELDALLSPNWSRALAADIESRTLSSLRDLLLPELLSGRLRVPVAEQSVR